MIQVMLTRRCSSLVAVNTSLAKDRLGFDLSTFVAHLEKVLDVQVANWNQVEFAIQHICDFVDEVKQSQTHHEHPRVLIFGADLENHFTAIALRFLAERLETYLLKDLTCSSDNKFEAVHEMRLFSICVIPTTMSQVLMEWIAFEADRDVKLRLTETLTLYRRLLVSAPH